MVGCQWGKHMSDRKEKTNCNTTLKELKELKYGWLDGIRVIWNWMLDISVFWNTCNINVFCQLVFLWPNYLQASLPPSCLCWTCAPSIDQVCRWPCAQLEMSVSSSCSLGWPLVRPLPPLQSSHANQREASGERVPRVHSLCPPWPLVRPPQLLTRGSHHLC